MNPPPSTPNPADDVTSIGGQPPDLAGASSPTGSSPEVPPPGSSRSSSPIAKRKSRIGRLLRWSIGTAIVAVSIGWCLHFPFDAERLYRAIPAESSIVTEHRALGPRWADVAQNPLVLAAAGATNAAETAAPGGMLAPETCRVVRHLAPHRTVVGYSPAMGMAGEPAWVLASYAGAKAQLLRWALSLGVARGMDALRSDSTVTWVQEDRSREAGRYLSIGITDGIIVACLSNTREAAAIVLTRMEARSPLVDVLQQRLAQPDDETPDRVWLRWRERGRGGAVFRRNAEIRLDLFTRTAFAGSLRMPVAEGGIAIRDAAARTAGSAKQGADPAPTPWDFPRRFVPDSAVGVVLLEPAGPRPFTSLCSDAPLSVRVVAAALDRMSAPESAAFAALFHGDQGGRLLGLKVPAVVIGVRANAGAAAPAEIRRVLDSLNAANRWGLLPRTVTLESGRSLTIVDSSNQDLIASLAERERPAVALHEDWLLLSSCASTLDRLIGGTDPPGFQKDPRWARAVGPSASAAFWLDSAAVEPAVRHALAVYEISLMLEDPRKLQQTREALEPVRRWTAALAEFQTVHVSTSRRGNLLTGRFAAGMEKR